MIEALKKIFLLILCIGFLYNSGITQEKIKYITKSQDSFLLKDYLFLVQDQDANYTIEQVTSRYFQKKLQPFINVKKTLQPHTWYWGKIKLKNQLTQKTKWVLYLGSSSEYEIHIFEPPNNYYQSKRTDILPPYQRQLIQKKQFELLLKPLTTYTIYFKIRTTDYTKPFLAPQLISYDFWQARQQQQIVQRNLLGAVFQGIFYITGILYLVVYFFRGSKSILYYALHILGQGLFFANYYFYTTYFQPSIYFYFLESGTYFFSLITLLLLIQYIPDNVNLYNKWKDTLRGIQGLLIIFWFLTWLNLTTIFHIPLYFWTIKTVNILAGLILAITGIFILKNKHPVKPYLLIGLAAILIPLSLRILTLSYLSPLTTSDLVYKILQTGVVIEVSAFILGWEHFNQIRGKKLYNIQQNVIQQLEEQKRKQTEENRFLESKIDKVQDDLDEKRGEILLQGNELMKLHEEIIDQESLIFKQQQILKTKSQVLDQHRKVLLNLTRNSHIQKGDKSAALRNITSACANTLQVYLVGIWEYDSLNNCLRNIIKYNLKQNEFTSGEVIYFKDAPAYFYALQHEKLIAIENTHQDSIGKELVQNCEGCTRLFSVLDVPYFMNNYLSGVIRCEQHDSYRNWTQEEQGFMTSIHDLLTIAYETAQSRQKELQIIQQKEEILLQRNSIEAKNKKLKEINQEIRKMNENLEQRVQKKSIQLLSTYEELETFLYRSSHDLRRPLTSLMGLAEVAKATLNETEAKELFEKVYTTAKNMDKMLTKLRMVSDMHEDNLTYYPIQFQKIIKFIRRRFQPIIQAKNIDMNISIEPDLIFISSDTLIHLLLLNLIENAIFFCAGEKPFVKIYIKKWQEDGVEIFIKDNGQGIDKEHHSRIFDMYFRANSSSKGNGLGLYVVKKAIDKLDGQIEFDSANRQGSWFRIYLKSKLPQDKDEED